MNLLAVPVANTTVLNSTTDVLTGFSNAGSQGLAIAILTGGVLICSVAFAFFVKKMFSRLTNIGDQNDITMLKKSGWGTSNGSYVNGKWQWNEYSRAS